MTEAKLSEPGSPEHKATFFRQSGWLMVANLIGGVMMWAVHFLSKRIPESEYGVLVTLFALTMMVPVLPLQMVFAQQTAKALASGHRAQLAQLIRRSALALFVVWLVWAGTMALFHQNLISTWQIEHPAALWVTLVGLLGALLLPLLWGLMQGKQDFLSLGWSMILTAVGRFGGAVLIVLVLGGYAAGIMSAVVMGFALAIAFSVYATRDLWRGAGKPFDRRELIRQVVPLVIGFGACQFLFTADTMFVKAWFPGEQVAYYGAAGTLSRALMWLVLPLAAVMFPKIVHSAARSEKTDLMTITLAGTAVLAVCGAFGLWLVGPFVIRLVYKSEYVAVAAGLLPWYAGAMIPLALANVLANNLLARGDYRSVPYLAILAVGYGAALCFWHDSFIQVLQVLTACNTVFFVLCALFTYVWKRAEVPAPAAIV